MRTSRLVTRSAAMLAAGVFGVLPLAAQEPGKLPATRAGLDSAIARAAAEAFLRGREAQRRYDAAEIEARIQAGLELARRRSALDREYVVLDSIARARTAQLALRQRLLKRGAYAGVGAGMSTALRGLRHGFNPAWTALVPVGWDDTQSAVGFRADLSVDHMNQTRAGSGDLTIISGGTNLKLRRTAPDALSRTHAYVTGGISLHRVSGGFRGHLEVDESDTRDRKAVMAFGWNAGAGFTFGWGPAELFVESRLVRVHANLTYGAVDGVGRYVAFTPVVVGIQWFRRSPGA